MQILETDRVWKCKMIHLIDCVSWTSVHEHKSIQTLPLYPEQWQSAYISWASDFKERSRMVIQPLRYHFPSSNQGAFVAWQHFRAACCPLWDYILPMSQSERNSPSSLLPRYFMTHQLQTKHTLIWCLILICGFMLCSKIMLLNTFPKIFMSDMFSSNTNKCLPNFEPPTQVTSLRWQLFSTLLWWK